MSRLLTSRLRPLPILLLIPILLFVGLLQAEAPDPLADKAILKAASALYDGVQVHTLDNGLKVYLKPVPGAATVTTMMAYKVGSADENLDSTGLSHYLEHLMFKGTKKLKPGDIDRLTQRNGGQNNAYTSEDLTNYHFDFSSDTWEIALEIEADRMQNLMIDKEHEFEQEKGAVIEELQRDEDQPWDLEQKAIVPMLFGPKAPYGHPVIGLSKHVKDATAAIIKAHYDRWYHPNNASLVVVGGFDPDKALAKIRTLFGPIPSAKLPERKPSLPVPTQRPERLEFQSKFEAPRILVGYNTVERTNPDAPALAVLDAVLSSGRSSRLYHALVDGAAVASSVNTDSTTGRYPGWFSLQMELLQGKDRAAAEKLLLAEVEKVRAKPITAEELKRAKQALFASAIFRQESVHGLADQIAQGVTIASLDWLKGYLPAVLAVTPADVQRVAVKYLDPAKSVTVWSVPPTKPKLEPKQGAAPTIPPRQSPARQQSRADAPMSGPMSLKNAKRIELPNGIVLLLLENHRLPIFQATAELRYTRLLEPADKVGVDALTGSMLDEGTTSHTGEQIAELIENVGGSLALGGGGGSVKVLSTDRSLGLSLLFDSLMHPNFPAEAFARNKERTLSALAEAETQPNPKARHAFLAAVYGDHPYAKPGAGTVETVKNLTAKDLAAFHARAFVPNNLTVAIVGDFDTKEVVAEIEKLTKDWKKGDLPKIKTPAVEKPTKFTQKIITMPEATQLQVFLGHVGIRRDNPDYYKLVVMDNVLGTGAGFTDRLSSRLRDREGLAYTVQANISSSATDEPGVFTGYIGIDPVNFARVKKEFLEEINRLRDEKPTDEEVADAKSYLLGSLAFLTATNGSVADLLLAVERYKLGFNYLDDYRKGVAAVTAADVQAVAKKYLDPEHMYLIAAGAIDQEGEDLETSLSDPELALFYYETPASAQCSARRSSLDDFAMGISVHYWAVPPSSTLFRRLQYQTAFAMLMVDLFPYGNGIFRFFEEVDPGEQREVLDSVMERRGETLGPKTKAKRWINAFRQELSNTRAAYPGVERRRASLEKTSELIEERLLREVRRVRTDDAEKLVRSVMFGDQQLGQDLELPYEDIVGLISAPLVQEGAEVLNKLDAEALFVRDSGWEEGHLADFTRWRQLFREAAVQGEALLVGVC